MLTIELFAKQQDMKFLSVIPFSSQLHISVHRNDGSSSLLVPQVLMIEPDTPEDQIRKAYRKVALHNIILGNEKILCLSKTTALVSGSS